MSHTTRKMQPDNPDTTLTALDALIMQARAKLRSYDRAWFGGETNSARIATCLDAQAPLGTLAVPAGVDATTTHGIMAAIDLTLLNKEATPAEIAAIAQRATHEHAATVCVYPEHVAAVNAITRGNPPPIAVVGFPFVAQPTPEALAETVQQTRAAIADGAHEIDMVLPRDFSTGPVDYAAHFRYLRAVVLEADKTGVPVKVILETAYLTDQQKVEACLLAKMAGAAFVKTSTGFAEPEYMRDADAPKGATPHDVALMRRSVGDSTLDDAGHRIAMGVKASGGVRSRSDAQAMFEAGANRIGASGSVDVRSLPEKIVKSGANNPDKSSGSGRAY